MDLSTLHKQLLPCNMDYPFAFISYSSVDKELVWSDVIELQSRGYNIWIDEANLDKSKDSWKEDALKAIEDYECSLLVFYVSEQSLTSEACLNELNQTIAETTKEIHFNKVDFIVVEVEKIKDMTKFMSEISQKIRFSDLSSKEKSRKTQILSKFQRYWFRGNEKVRIHSKKEPDRISDYYSDIEVELSKRKINCSMVSFQKMDLVSQINTNEIDKIIQSLLKKSSLVYDTVTSPNGRFSFFECNDKLFPAARPIQSKYSKSDKKEISDISKFYLECGNLLLVGEGGIGKTTSLLKAWKDLLEDHSKYRLIPFYIPLNEANSITNYTKNSETNFIIDYICNYYKINFAKIDVTLTENISQLQYGIILLLDGFNEISDRNTQIAISKEVKELSQNYKIRIIMTSRFDFIYTYGLENFQRYNILPLEESIIKEYLISENILSVNISYSLISNPMMLMLFTNMCNIKEHISELLVLPFSDNNTKGELIYNFIYCQIGKDFRIDNINKTYLLYIALLVVCPYIAYDIEKKGEFSFDYSLITDYVKSALKYYQNFFPELVRRDLFSLSGYETFEISIDRSTVTSIVKILLEDIVILQQDARNLSFRHQYFRDFFSAWYVINDIEIALQLNNVPLSLVDRILPEFIACFVGDCTHDYKYISKSSRKNILSKLTAHLNGNISNEAYLTLNNVISIHKLSRNNDLSSIHFKGVDLSKISLNGVLLSHQIKDESFYNCKISSRTFLSQGHTGHVRSAVYNNSGTVILSAGDTTIKEWDCLTGQCIKTYIGHTNLVNTAYFHPNEDKILSAANDNTVCEWDRITGKCLYIFKDHTGYVTKAIYDSTGDKILSCSWDGTVLFYERTNTGWSNPKLVARHTKNIKSIYFKQDNNSFITASGDGSVREWMLDGTLQTVYSGHTDMVNSAIYAIDDFYVISGGYDNTVRIFCTGISEEKYIINNINSWVRNVVYDDVYKNFLIAVHDGNIFEYSLSKKNGFQLISKYVGHKKAVTSVSLSTDGSKVISTSEDGTIREWDRKSNQCIHIYNGIDLSMTDTVYSSDGHLVLTIKDCEFTISKRTDGIPFFSSEKHSHAITSAVFGNNNDTIIYTTEKGLFLRNISDNSPKCLIDANKEHVLIKYAQYDEKNNGIIAIGTNIDRKTVVFLLDSTENLKKFIMPVNADFVKFYNDEEFITFSAGGIIRIWKATTGQEVGILGVNIKNCIFKNCEFEDHIIKDIIKEAGGIIR